MSGALRIGLVGPLPPPAGGMANQTRQLAGLLEQQNVEVDLVATNARYRPALIAGVPVVRALFRLLPYVLRLWQVAGRVQLFHVMANSGWSWHLFAAPAVLVAKARGIPVVVNYRGGAAEEFLARSSGRVAPVLRRADRLVVPSRFLQQVFARFGFDADIVPNIIDLNRFQPRTASRGSSTEPHIIVTRNLEAIYDVETALRAFARVTETWPKARMTIAGTGPQREMLEQLSKELGVASRVTFAGALDNMHIPALYRDADVFLNVSVVDNMPISILEALASELPVVSTRVGGIPYIVEHGRTAILVSPREPEEAARAILELLADRDKANALARAGRETVQQYGWPSVRARLFEIYAEIAPDAALAPLGCPK